MSVTKGVVPSPVIERFPTANDPKHTRFNSNLKVELGKLDANYLSNGRVGQLEKLLYKTTPFVPHDISLAHNIMAAEHNVQVLLQYVDSFKDRLQKPFGNKYQSEFELFRHLIEPSDTSAWLKDDPERIKRFQRAVVEAFYEAFNAQQNDQTPLTSAIQVFVERWSTSYNDGIRILVGTMRQVASTMRFPVDRIQT